jgi:hypothetical protein
VSSSRDFGVEQFFEQMTFKQMTHLHFLYNRTLSMFLHCCFYRFTQIRNDVYFQITEHIKKLNDEALFQNIL